MEPRGIHTNLYRFCQWTLHLQFRRWLSQLRPAGQYLCRMLRRQRQHHRNLSRWNGNHRPRPHLLAAVRRRRPQRGRSGYAEYPPARTGSVCTGQLAALEQTHTQLRLALGSADPGRCNHRSSRGLLRRFHWQNRHQSDGYIHIPIQRRNPFCLGLCSSRAWA